MQAGKLRHSVTLQTPVAGSPQRTASGQPDAAWTTLCTTYASVEALSGRRLEAAQATWPEATVEIKMRYRADVYNKDRDRVPLRALFGSRYYAVGKVLNPEERNVELRLLCKEGAARG
jgi:SPP1 family predicted phage head-tail adaptor